MEITNFVTENFLSSFAGTLVTVELIVFTTKEFTLIKKIPTKLYTFILAVIHLFIVQIIIGKSDITIGCVYLLFVNSLIVELILCGGYDTLMSKLKSVRKSANQSKEDIGEKNSKKTTTNSKFDNNNASDNVVGVSKTNTNYIDK